MLHVVLTPRAADELRALAPPERRLAASALADLPGCFGRPHVHSGLGLRQLRPGLYELRVGLALRAIFVRHGLSLEIQAIGTHDAVRRFIRRR